MHTAAILQGLFSYFLAVRAVITTAIPVITPTSDILFHPDLLRQWNTLLHSNPIFPSKALLPTDAMLPIHTPSISTKITIWGEQFEEIAPGEYEIVLRPGYTLEQHFTIIGKHFGRPQIHHVSDQISDPEICDYDGYMLHYVDQADLDLIRRDPGVQYIGLVAYGKPIDDAVPLEKWAELEEQERVEQERIGKGRDGRGEL